MWRRQAKSVGSRETSILRYQHPITIYNISFKIVKKWFKSDTWFWSYDHFNSEMSDLHFSRKSRLKTNGNTIRYSVLTQRASFGWVLNAVAKRGLGLHENHHDAPCQQQANFLNLRWDFYHHCQSNP